MNERERVPLGLIQFGCNIISCSFHISKKIHVYFNLFRAKIYNFSETKGVYRTIRYTVGIEFTIASS